VIKLAYIEMIKMFNLSAQIRLRLGQMIKWKDGQDNGILINVFGNLLIRKLNTKSNKEHLSRNMRKLMLKLKINSSLINKKRLFKMI
jgi:hypothetical protein